ncbi:MAG: family 43 glycosylhydrolase [Eubacteriales bacterium]
MNPILPRTDFIPDAEAHVMPDGRLYIYGSLDQSGHREYCSTVHKVFSTGDRKLENWVDHGITFSNGADDSLTWKPGITLYAPDAIECDGKYYLYVCGAGSFEGVSVSDKPQGPFGKAKPILHADGDSIDPAVFIDDDKQAYYLWGQFNLRGAKLCDDMSTLDESSIVTNLLTEQEHGFHEGSSMRKRNGIYYIVYTDISRGKATCMSYAVSDKPLGPYKKGGVIIDNIYCDPDTWNNHGSIEEYKGQWYVFYHRSTQNCKACRRVCVEPIFFDENGKIAEVMMTSQGASSPISAFGDIDASVACRLKGNAYITVCDGRGEILANCGGGNWIYDWAEYRYIDFDKGTLKGSSAAADDALTFTVCSRGSGRIHIMSEKEGRSFIAGFCDISSEDFSVFEARINKIKGVQPIWLLFEGKNISVDYFCFRL